MKSDVTVACLHGDLDLVNVDASAILPRLISPRATRRGSSSTSAMCRSSTCCRCRSSWALPTSCARPAGNWWLRVRVPRCGGSARYSTPRTSWRPGCRRRALPYPLHVDAVLRPDLVSPTCAAMLCGHDGGPPPNEGRLLDGRYRLGSLLGVGGVAEVYRALDERLHRGVAVKLFRGRRCRPAASPRGRDAHTGPAQPPVVGDGVRRRHR